MTEYGSIAHSLSLHIQGKFPDISWIRPLWRVIYGVNYFTKMIFLQERDKTAQAKDAMVKMQSVMKEKIEAIEIKVVY